MLRDVGEFDGQGFSFGEMARAHAPAVINVDHGAEGATATIADAHLLFNADFVRSGNDLHLNGHDGGRAIVRDYFIADESVALVSGEGARLSPHVIEALTGGIAPAQYAQAGGQPAASAANDAVGRVVTTTGDAVILRNGVPVTLRPGDPVLRADVLQTTSGTMAVTFNDGSTLNLTANTRIVVSEFVYSPNGAGNSQLLDLVQGSLTFISGEVAHSGNMRIGTPVATMGIRGTVGGVTTASDGTVQFYVSQSNVGAVIINAQGQIIANVVQDGPLIIVRPVGPLQVIAEELQKTPQQLALELQALQTIVNIKAVGDQLLQQFQQQQQTPNPQTPQNGPHTQFQTEQKLAITFTTVGDENGGIATPGVVTFGPVNQPGDQTGPGQVTVPMPANLAPVTFAPLNATLKEDNTLSFSGNNAITVADADSQVVTITVSAPHGTLTSGSLSGGTLTLSGSPAAVNAMLAAMTYTPPQDYNGAVTLTVVTTDGTSSPITTGIAVNVTPVNDAPVIAHAPGAAVAYTENGAPKAISAGLTLSDVDSATLSGAKVFISGNFACGQDVLNFTAQGGITGSYDPQTGILTLSGVASVADYQAVLRSVTYKNTSDDPSDAPRTISFEVNDGSSENATSVATTVTVNVTPVNDAPVLNFFNVELNGGEPVTLTTDMFDVTDPDGPTIIFTVTDVTGGSFVVDTGGNLFSVMLLGEGGSVSFTAEDIAANRVTFVPDGSGDPVRYSVSVSDGEPGSPSSSLPQVVDHQPVAEDIGTVVTAGPPRVNTCFVLDYSGSVSDTQLDQMLDAVKAAAQALFASDAIVNIDIVVFGSSAVHLGSFASFGSLASALDNTTDPYPRPVSSGTDFSRALEAVMDNFEPVIGTKNEVFFISDGQSSSGIAEGWLGYVKDNHINVTAVGIGNGYNEVQLKNVDVDGKGDVVGVAEFGDLVDELVTRVEAPLVHNIFGATGADYGADGTGRIVSLVVDGVTHTRNDAAASIMVVTLLGGTLTFYFAADEAHAAGDWIYTPPANVEHSVQETFRYTIADADGDKASADINVTVLDKNGPDPVQDFVVTNASEFDIPDWVLLRNDHNAGNLLKVSDASAESCAISVDDCGDRISVTLNDTNSETFQYVATDPNDKDASTTVSVTQTCDLDLSDSTADTIIIAGNSGVSMAGGSGSDVLIGGTGHDTMTGNGGADAFVFNGNFGNDTVTDFQKGTDKLVFESTCFATAQEALESLTGGSTEAVFHDGGNSVTLTGVDMNSLTVDDIIIHNSYLV